jgi:hypothetical protein
MNKTLLVMVIVVVAAAGISAYFYLSNSRAISPPVLFVSSPKDATIPADVYPLYSGASWSPVEATTSPDYGEVSVIQSQPFINITDIAAKSTPFTTYYHDKLLHGGWVQDMQREAGGPGAEISVYTKGDQFVVVAFSSIFHDQKPDAPAQCPCDLRFSLMSGIEHGSK